MHLLIDNMVATEQRDDDFNDNSMTTKQYGALFRKDVAVASRDESKNDLDRESLLDFEASMVARKTAEEMDQAKILQRYNKQTGLNILQNNKIASMISSEFFLKRSTVAFDDCSGIDEILYDPPKYNKSHNYYSMFWSSYCENEQILNDIQEITNENHLYLN